MTISPWPDARALALCTDLYQLTMMAGYAAAGIDRQHAVFELFVRKMPANRAYLIFAGLEQALGDLLGLRFSYEQIDHLRRLPTFKHVDPAWFDTLAQFRFTGNIWAMAEGTACFAGETLVRVEAPLAEAQLIETYLLSTLAYPTSVASKAARCVEVAGDRALIEFGARRGHGPYAVFLAARAAYIAGFTGTSHVEAARRLGIPAVGTMAHSWVQSFATELEAFRAYAISFPDDTTCLVDTYDTLEGVRIALRVTPPVQGIRLDSGDLATLATKARAILDAAGRHDAKILASGDLDERKIEELLRAGAPIDAFGIGTELITVRDAPAISMVYKLVELNGQGRFKLSPGKKTYPCAKQVWRQRDGQGTFTGDHVTLACEAAAGEPLLVQWVREGTLVSPLPGLDAIRAHCRSQRIALPAELRTLEARPTYPIGYSEALEAAAQRLGVH
jgi:nicotinate phosphoribosyltransferase